jgi:hypothetical protein
MALFIKREFTWAEGAGKSSIRFIIKIAPVEGESAATTTRRFKQDAARLAQAFVREHESHNAPSPKGKNHPADHSIGGLIMQPT